MKLQKYTDLISPVASKHAFDVLRIMQILANKGYICDSRQAEELWQKFSNSMAAGWMMPPTDDEEVFDCIRAYID